MNYKQPNVFKFPNLTVQRLAQSVSRWTAAVEVIGLDSCVNQNLGYWEMNLLPLPYKRQGLLVIRMNWEK